jgi:CRP-like cAMP-binding protein
VLEFDPSAFVADPELIQALDKHSSPVPSGKGQILFRQGEPAEGLFILCEGSATLTMHGVHGQTVLAVEIRPGSLLGLPGLIGNQPYSMTARAGEKARVQFITRDQFTRFMQTESQLALKVLQVLAAEVRTARRALY